MPYIKRNRKDNKEENEDLTVSSPEETQKKNHNPRNLEDVSTARDASNPDNDKTGIRKDKKTN